MFTLVTLVPLLLAVIGLLLFALSGNRVVQAVGKALLWIGLFFLVAPYASSIVRLP